MGDYNGGTRFNYPNDSYWAYSFDIIDSSGNSIVIDWHFAVDVATNGFGSRTNQVESTKKTSRSRLSGVPTKNHKTSTIGSNKENSGAITLEDCLDAFAEEEKTPEVRSS